MTKWIYTVATMVALSTSAAAQDGGDGRDGRPRERRQRPERQAPALDEVIARADADKDGKISKDEFLKDAYARFQERMQGGGGRRGGPDLDRDGDGEVSLEEFKAGPMGEERFARLDADKTGFLERPEIEAMLAERGPGGRGRMRPEELVKRFDKNGDGKVAKDEFEGPEGMFGRLDRNGDGFIDAADAPPAPPTPPAPPATPPAPKEPAQPGKPGEGQEF